MTAMVYGYVNIFIHLFHDVKSPDTDRNSRVFWITQIHFSIQMVKALFISPSAATNRING